MQMDDMILVSIDDHIIEPADMFEGHMPEEYADQAPKIVATTTGVEQWEFQGNPPGTLGLNAVVGVAEGGVGLRPGRLSGDAARRLRRPRAASAT